MGWDLEPQQSLASTESFVDDGFAVRYGVLVRPTGDMQPGGAMVWSPVIDAAEQPRKK